MEILIALAIAYAIASPDSFTLAATRGVAGAARTFWKKDNATRSDVARGARRGVKAARARRADGADTWSQVRRATKATGTGVVGASRGVGWAVGHVSRAGRRVVDAARRRGDRTAPEARPVMNILDDVEAPKPTATNTLKTGPRGPQWWVVGADGATRRAEEVYTPEVMERLYRLNDQGYVGWATKEAKPMSEEEVIKTNPDLGKWIKARRADLTTPTKTPTPAKPTTPPKPSAPTPTAPTKPGNPVVDLDQRRKNRAADTPATPTTEGTTPMEKTELNNLDSVEAEVKTVKEILEGVNEALGIVRDWAENLADRWSGTDWETTELNDAVTAVSDSAASLGDPEPMDVALTAALAGVEKARGLGEVAGEAGASGDLGAFQPA